MVANVPAFSLNDGSTMPQIGLGIYGPDDAGAATTVASALEVGYRLLDTAAYYGNEVGVGVGMRRSGIPRSEIYLTTKLGNDSHGFDATLAAFEASLDRLGTDYVDLYLIHWPMTAINQYVESWRAFESILTDGRATSIGVSNFQEHHLKRLLSETDIVPAVNQIEVHPGHQRRAMREFNAQHSIATIAWSPLAGNPGGHGSFVNNPTVQGIAERHGKSGAQVIIRWHLQLGNILIPKTTSRSRMMENLEVFDFALTGDELTVMSSLENGIANPYDPDLAD